MAVDGENTAPPSTPPTSTSPVFSSDAPAINASSPASSPPAFPWDCEDDGGKAHANQSLHAPPRNIFSVLGKRKLAPLSENTGNITVKKVKKSDDGKTQMQLHLGQKIQKRCNECGMQYVASSNEDRSLHAKFHKQHTEGVDVGTGFVENAPFGRERRVYDGVAERADDKVVLVDCFDKKPRKRKGQEVMEIVQRDLGAVEIAEAEIWEPVKGDGGEPRYRSFMYISGGKCVGFLLVERIHEAFEVLPPKILRDEAIRHTPPTDQPTAKNKPSALAALRARKLAAETARAEKEAMLQAAAKEPLVLAETKTPASLGISRIWTLPSHRGQGIAVSLLDAAIHWHSNHVRELLKSNQKLHCEATEGNAPGPNFDVLDDERAVRLESKHHVAFSQPTAAGTKLARKWMGKMSGWKVYVD